MLPSNNTQTIQTIGISQVVDFYQFTAEEVANWLSTIPNVKKTTLEKLIENDMCGTAIIFSSVQELVDIGIVLGQAKLIQYHVSRMHTTSHPTDQTIRYEMSDNLTIAPTPPLNRTQPTNQQNILLQKAVDVGGYFGFLDKKIFKLDYEQMGEIGVGSFGQVLKVKNNKNGQIRAVKKILITDDSASTKIILEAVTLGKLYSNPFVIPLYDSFISVEGGNTYLCIEMEYVENGSLYTWFIEKHIFPSVNQVYKIIRDICLGLEMIHRANILHRDIKPKNILLPQVEGLLKVYIADFGLAKPISENSTLGSTIVGTDSCVAPEIIIASKDTGIPYSTRSDIFSLGATIYQIMTRDCANKLATMSSFPIQIRNNLKCANNGSYPPVLIELVMKMLEEKPENRITIENIIKYCDNNGKELVETQIITPQLEVKHVAITFEPVPPNFDAICLVSFTNNQSKQQNVRIIRIVLQKWINEPQLSITYDSVVQTRSRGIKTKRKLYYKYRDYIPYYPLFQIECVNDCGETFNVVYADTSTRYLIDVGGSEYKEAPEAPPKYSFEKVTTLPEAKNLPLLKNFSYLSYQ